MNLHAKTTHNPSSISPAFSTPWSSVTCPRSPGPRSVPRRPGDRAHPDDLGLIFEGPAPPAGPSLCLAVIAPQVPGARLRSCGYAPVAIRRHPRRGPALAVPASANAVARILPGQAGLKDLDARTGHVTPTAAQKQAVDGPRRARAVEPLRHARVADRRRRVPQPAPRAVTRPRRARLHPRAPRPVPAVGRRRRRPRARQRRQARRQRRPRRALPPALRRPAPPATTGMITVGVQRRPRRLRLLVGRRQPGGARRRDAQRPRTRGCAPPPTPASASPRADVTAIRTRDGWTTFGVAGPRHAARPGHQAPRRPARAPRRVPDLHAGRARRVRDDRARRRRRPTRAPTARSSTPAPARCCYRSNEVKQAADDENGTGTLLRQHRRRRQRLRRPAPDRRQRRVLDRRVRDREPAVRRHRPAS